MKTKQFTILLMGLCIITYMITSTMDTPEIIVEEDVNVIEPNQNCFCSSTSSNSEKGDTVLFDDAARQVYYYRLWERMLPDSFYWSDSTTISFTPQTVEPEDRDTINRLIEEFCDYRYKKNSTKCSECKEPPYQYPFTFREDENVAESYFIPIDDVIKAMNSVPPSESANGIRVFMALEETHYGGDISTHLLVAPAYVDPNDNAKNRDHIPVNSQNERYLLDLTMPCPKTCPPAEHRTFHSN